MTSKNKRRSMQRISKNFKISWLYLVSCKDADFESQLADMPYLAPYESEEKMKGSFLKLGILGMAMYGSHSTWRSGLCLERDFHSFIHVCVGLNTARPLDRY